MAYGVKYRLEFSDVNGYGKKVEILKKDYTGEVLPMIGTGNPVVVKWKSTDDFYKPIIGSSCVLNLLVTEENQYDDFYKFDEKEFKIEVFYSETKKQAFSERVIDDNGVFESLNCLDNSLKLFPETKIYKKYWSGFIVVDRYKEAMIDFPYKISLNAFDGLGTLSNYDAPLETTTETDLTKIYKILQNTSLDLDIVFMNDLNFKNSDDTISKYPNIKTINEKRFEFKDGFDTYTAKEMLSHLLTIYNMRIFQSFNRFYIVENCNSFDSDVKKQIRDLNTDSNPPSNIRELITNKLKSLSNEFIDAKVYNSNGVLQGTEKIATVKTAPKHLKPLKSDLTREFLQPLESTDIKVSTKQYEKTYYTNNPGFEFGTNGSYNWIIESNNAEIVADEISKKGKYSIKLKSTTNLAFKCFTSNVIPFENPFIPGQYITYISTQSLNGFKYSFSYFVEASDILTNCIINYRIKYEGIYSGNTVTYYFNEGNNNWQTTPITQTINVNSFNSWQTKTKKLTDELTSVYLGSGDLYIEIWQTTVASSSVSDYITTYFDDTGIYQEGAELYTFLWLEGIEKIVTPSKDVIALRSDDQNYTSKKSYSTIMLPTDSPSQSENWYRSRDYNLIAGNTTEYKKIFNVRNQGIMNDFREACIRYDGTFRDLTGTPLGLHNKIWFNWENVLNDKQSTILDSLTYNVKENAYKVLSHLPNDDNDLNVNIKIKT